MHIFRLDGVKKSFVQAGAPLTVFENLFVTFEQGKTYAIIGVSGSGKSTLLHILAGIESPTSGTVFYDEKAISQFNGAQKSDFLLHLGLIFQQPYLIKELSVLENVMIKGGLTKNKNVKKTAEQLLESVGLANKINEYPASLSGGQQQRVAIARALMNRPAFLLADEPTGSLDVKTGTEIVQLLLDLSRQWNMGLIVSSHERYVFDKMEKAFELKEGTLV